MKYARMTLKQLERVIPEVSGRGRWEGWIEESRGIAGRKRGREDGQERGRRMPER